MSVGIGKIFHPGAPSGDNDRSYSYGACHTFIHLEIVQITNQGIRLIAKITHKMEKLQTML